MRKIFVVGNSLSYANWMQGTIINTMKDADLVVFTGGEDISPELYDEHRHPYTHFNEQRDSRECFAFSQAYDLKKPCIGICRGAQLLSALNGAKLIQDQDNPGTHYMDTFDGGRFQITSMHHQAAYPFNLDESDYRILGWTESLLRHHEDANRKELNPPKEVEMIYFPASKCFGIQGHPEMMKPESNTVKYLQGLLDRFLDNTL